MHDRQGVIARRHVLEGQGDGAGHIARGPDAILALAAQEGVGAVESREDVPAPRLHAVQGDDDIAGHGGRGDQAGDGSRCDQFHGTLQG